MERYTINQLAKYFDTDTKALRKLENEYGILVPKNNAGHRYYTENEKKLFIKIKFYLDKGLDKQAIKKLISDLTEVNLDIPSNKSITISDVAKAAGVSLGTVSRVLNNRDGKIKISDSTKEKVLSVAKELGYKPNPFASALRGQKTGVIGAILRDINDPFLRQMVREVQRVSHSKGIEILFGHAGYDLETAERQINLMMNHWFDGLIMIGNLVGDERIFAEIQGTKTPIVTIATGHKMNMPSVNYDNLIGTNAALDYLYKLGHRRIAFIGNVELAGVQERYEGYKDFVKKHRLFMQDEYCRPKTASNSAIATTKEILSLPNPPTAFFCGSDLLALSAINGALQLGLQVPGDVSIIGYDDIEEAMSAFPTLTTVCQPINVAAEKSIEILLKLIENPQCEELYKDIIITPKLVIRNSCTNPKE